MSYNPKLKEFMEANPNLTVMGLVWAGFWRIYLIIIGVCFGLAFLGALAGN